MTETTAPPPTARVAPRTSIHHGRMLVDDYAWLQQKDDPDVLAYLEAENAYARNALRHTKALQERLFQEMCGRIAEAIAHRADTLIEDVGAFRDHLVVYERQGGLKRIRISAPDGVSNARYVAFPEPVYTFEADAYGVLAIRQRRGQGLPAYPCRGRSE